MRLYRYWAAAEKSIKDAHGKVLLLKQWGGSNDNLDDAKRIAEGALDVVIEKISRLDRRKASHYDYFIRNTPEEVIGDIAPSGGVTRNRMGCKVLNTNQMMFVDIDRRFGSHFLAKWLRRTENDFLAAFELWMQNHPDMGARIYRTAGGLRYLFTHAPVKPDAQAIGWMEEMGADHLYVRLCRVQECYRARLSPKYWRINMKDPPNAYPRQTSQQQASFEKWLAEYETKSKGFAVCKFIKSLGNPRIHGDLQPILSEHDRATMATSSLPLA